MQIAVITRRPRRLRPTNGIPPAGWAGTVQGERLRREWLAATLYHIAAELSILRDQPIARSIRLQAQNDQRRVALRHALDILTELFETGRREDPREGEWADDGRE